MRTVGDSEPRLCLKDGFSHCDVTLYIFIYSFIQISFKCSPLAAAMLFFSGPEITVFVQEVGELSYQLD